MKRSLIKPYLPRTLFGRAALIYLVPVLTILGVMSVVFIQRLYEDVTRQMTSGVVDEIRLVLNEIEGAGNADAALASAAPLANTLSFELGFSEVVVLSRRQSVDLSGVTIIATLNELLPGFVGADLIVRDAFVRVGIETRHGLLYADIPRLRFSARNPHQFLVLIGTTALIDRKSDE